MTPDQEQRLLQAVQNTVELLEAFNGTGQDYVETFISFFNGKADDLAKDEPTMPRGRKKAQPSPTATTTAAPAATSIAVPQADRDRLIGEWHQAKQALIEVQDKERVLRQMLVTMLFDGTKLEGSETVDIGYGCKLKSTKEMYYNATNKDGQLDAVNNALAARGAEAEAMFDELINWAPEVRVKAYRKILETVEKYNDQEMKTLLHAAITVKPGMPQLELITPATPESPSVAQPPEYVLEKGFQA